MIINLTQRWTAGRKPIYRPAREYINPRHFEISSIDEATAKDFVVSYHYSKSYSAARRRFGLFEKGNLVGVAVYSHPMSEKVITNVFKCERGSDGLELGRLVLKDSVLANGESFFVGECHRRLRREGFCGVVSFADDVPRRSADGTLVHAGHLGIVYQALGAAFLQRGTASKLSLLPDGTVLSNRTISKIRAGESGWEYGAEILQSFGADKCPSDPALRKAWLRYWLPTLTRPLHHPGNLKYAWSFTKSISLRGYQYPKMRFGDLQPVLNFGDIDGAMTAGIENMPG